MIYPYATANILERHIERTAGIYLNIFYVTMSAGGAKFNTWAVAVFNEKREEKEERKVKLITVSQKVGRFISCIVKRFHYFAAVLK